GASEVPREALLSHLGKMLSTAPLSDAESSDEEAEYVEYIYKPRPYFMTALCNHCKMDLCGRQALPCKDCGLSYYCCMPHMREDHTHRQLCYGLRQLVQQNGHDIFYKSADFDAEQFRSYRIVCIRHLEKLINRPLSATEQELLLFPLICNQNTCREHRFKRLVRCGQCGEVAYCKDQATHLSATHAQWCGAYKLFKALVIFQSKFGRVEPPLPDAVLKDLPMACSNTRQILKKLHFNVSDECEFAALTQISTGPLTVFYALKLCNRLRESELTVHLIGAEMEFEVDVFQKWELFLLHILPPVQTLNVVFVGPELNPNNINFEQLKKIRCCRLCRKAQRTVQYYFENRLYHDYCKDSKFIHPDLVCFFNSGLYRSTGFALEDTWPDTIRASLDLKCPIVVTSYTKYEAPLDMSQFINESNRHLNVALPPTTNPFASEKPERNFISDHDAPFMFKNYQCFVIE
ncbi:CG13458, partial [Drosophila busckii]